jgi:hypothetical protein
MVKTVFSSDITKLNGSPELILGYLYVSIEFHIVVVVFCVTDLQWHHIGVINFLRNLCHTLSDLYIKAQNITKPMYSSS